MKKDVLERIGSSMNLTPGEKKEIQEALASLVEPEAVPAIPTIKVGDIVKADSLADRDDLNDSVVEYYGNVIAVQDDTVIADFFTKGITEPQVRWYAKINEVEVVYR